MATHGRIAIRAVRTLSGTAIPIQSFPEAATQTFKAGALVVLTVGYLGECGADPTKIMGLATKDGQNGATAGAKSQPVVLAHPDTLFIGNLDNGSGSTTSAATDRGKAYGVAKHSGSGKWYVDATDTTAKRVVIWDFWDQVIDGVPMTPGDIMLPVVFAFDPVYFQGGSVV